MKVTAIYKINESYVVGDNKKIYRLPFESNKKYYSLRELKEYKKGFYINTNYIKKEDIKYSKITPFVLIEDKCLPF